MAERIWRLAMTAKLGNVWHLSCYGDERPGAHCNGNVRLDAKSKTTEPGTTDFPGAVCGRCTNIAWHLDRRPAPEGKQA